MKSWLAVILVAFLACNVSAQRAEQSDTDTSDDQASSTLEATVLEAPQDPSDAQDLPEFDQRAIVDKQRQRLEAVKHTLQLQMVASESDHFLLFSDLNTPVRNAILIWLEDLRSKLITQLKVDPQVRLWDGKCLVLVFARQEFLKTFADTFDNHPSTRPRGYFVLEARYPRGPRLVHIAAYQPLRGGNEALREVLVHETTHAIIELYKKSAPLPLWLHEGLAEYMTLLVDPTLRPVKQAPAFRVATAAPYESIAPIFTSRFTSTNIAAYSISMGLVECLHRIDPAGVMHYVELLKNGDEPEAALKEAYGGLDYDGLERRWREFCMRYYRPPIDETNP